ncbi:helix-turn-helix transcriptional regulator [Streptomyces silvisoli]|uniref:Helix-turn-helix transcriptional regulator n=1 Tax=Streptomyces silvisoli TaxID=3034235 RepID=A0ABT5ZQN1_9ACTN|nr:helix-turn-helix transcriptional regulator [Streptomyces silvisoli]MDF3291910.1 helix-turn-helix transcriptional regulator [Streptomyces silvisoli]
MTCRHVTRAVKIIPFSRIVYREDGRAGGSAVALTLLLYARRQAALSGLTTREMVLIVVKRRADGSNDVTEEEFPSLPTGVAGQYMGFGATLKQWRKAAGVIQPTAARALGVSERTYRNIERGATPRFTQAQCDALAKLLKLDRDERHALLLYNVGTYLRSSPSEGRHEVNPALRLLIDRQMPSPTYLSDRNWNIIAYNTAMAELWPWVMEPRANIIRWALTTPEGRATYHDWHKHATVFVRMLRFAQTTHGDDADLQELIEDVKRNPEVRQIWESDVDLVEHRDGHVFLASVPTLGWRTIEIVSHVAYPAIMPDCRFVVMTWVEAESDGQRDALGGARNAWADETHNTTLVRDRAQERIAEADRLRAEDVRTARLVVESAGKAAAQAGEEGVPLPALSRLVGPACQLTLSPSKRNVVWAVEETPGQWGVTEVSPSTVIARVPRGALSTESRAEMKRLTRIALPAAREAAVARIEQLIGELQEEQRLLHEIQADLAGYDHAARASARPSPQAVEHEGRMENFALLSAPADLLRASS